METIVESCRISGFIKPRRSQINRTFARHITTTLTGPILAAGILTGGIGFSASAQAQSSTGSVCTPIAAPITLPNPLTLNPLTRAGQVQAISPPQQKLSPAVSCLSS